MTQTKRMQIDDILRQIATIKANVGKDSTKEELKQARHDEKELVNKIKRIDPEFFKEIEEDK